MDMQSGEPAHRTPAAHSGAHAGGMHLPFTQLFEAQSVGLSHTFMLPQPGAQPGGAHW
jgi:hypothetical protein